MQLAKEWEQHRVPMIEAYRNARFTYLNRDVRKKCPLSADHDFVLCRETFCANDLIIQMFTGWF